MASDFKIYPSGFVGSSLPAQVAPESTSEIMRRMMSRTHVPEGDSRYTASQEVKTLAGLVANNDSRIRDFNGHMRIIQLFLNHMGTNTLGEWLKLQWASGEFSDNHSRWVDETIRFAYGGQARNLVWTSWQSVLTAGNNQALPPGLSATHRQFLGDSTVPLRELAVMWVRQDGGIYDMANALTVMYGGR